MNNQAFQSGDWVIYRKTKFSTHPGPRAENISAAENGDLYVYTVDKFWVVESVENGVLTLKTRRGKKHTVKLPALNLHKATLLERWWFRSRFENVASGRNCASGNCSEEAHSRSLDVANLHGKAS